MRVWKPKDNSSLEGCTPQAKTRTFRSARLCWRGFRTLLLVVCVLGLGIQAAAGAFEQRELVFPWPGLHNLIQRMPPAVKPARAHTTRSTHGTGSPLRALPAWSPPSSPRLVLGMTPSRFLRVLLKTVRQLLLAELTIATVLGARFSDELFRSNCDDGSGVRGDGSGFPVLQRLARLDGRIPHRQRHFRQRAVRQSASGDGQAAGMNPVLMAASNSAAA